ncbi:transcriptional regulator [Delftia sp. WSY_14]|uniref:transcriptional regulator n=1 Tax=unclassified Delftia TaxID=2613839 RepID=UPI00370A8287
MKLSDYLHSQGRGSKARLARAIGAHASDLSDWLGGARSVPLHRCTAIEVATEGAVSRRDLRPDDWQSHWPELANASEVAIHG